MIKNRFSILSTNWRNLQEKMKWDKIQTILDPEIHKF